MCSDEIKGSLAINNAASPRDAVVGFVPVQRSATFSAISAAAFLAIRRHIFYHICRHISAISATTFSATSAATFSATPATYAGLT